jgi:hypothetical protein
MRPSLSTARYRLDPLAAHLDIRLIHTPGVADWPCVMIPALFKLREILLHPPKNGRMSQQDTALGHHLDQVTGTEVESEVPSHTQNDDLLVRVPPLEQILCRGRFHHPGRYGCAPVFSSLHQNLQDGIQRRTQCLTPRRETVLHFGTYLRIDFTHDDAIGFRSHRRAQRSRAPSNRRGLKAGGGSTPLV